jgi:hypothetical protein
METDVRHRADGHRIGEGEMSRMRRVMAAAMTAAALAGTAQACSSASPTEPTRQVTPDAPRDTSEHIPAEPSPPGS